MPDNLLLRNSNLIIDNDSRVMLGTYTSPTTTTTSTTTSTTTTTAVQNYYYRARRYSKSTCALIGTEYIGTINGQILSVGNKYTTFTTIGDFWLIMAGDVSGTILYDLMIIYSGC